MHDARQMVSVPSTAAAKERNLDIAQNCSYRASSIAHLPTVSREIYKNDFTLNPLPQNPQVPSDTTWTLLNLRGRALPVPSNVAKHV
jgi:hypothetical protein